MATGCFISTGRSLAEAVERVRLAESLGYESVYVTHIAGRESLTVLTAYALATSRIRVGTGVVPIYTRTPATMAQTAATIDELSDGRLTLGLGVSHRVVVEGWHGQTIDRPVDGDARIRLDRARHPARRGSARGREVAHRLSPHGPRPAPAASDLHRRALPCDAAPRRRARRRCAAVAVLPAVHQRCRHPRGHRGARARGQDARGLRHRAPPCPPPSPRTAQAPTPRCAATSSPTSGCPSTAR